MSYSIKLMRRAWLSAGLAATLASPVLGQQNRGSGIDNLLRERVRQLNTRTLEKELRKPAKQREQSLAFAQIKEDYARIQSLNQDLTQLVARGGPFDLKFIAKSASEIKRRAGRLKYNLVLPKPEAASRRAQAPVGTETEQLKWALSALRGVIFGFVNNPVFKVAHVVDAQSPAKARRDLEQIIELSERVRQSSERLHKAAPKSQ